MADPKRLRLLAQDPEDLDVVSAAMQDAVLKVGDIAYEAKARRLTIGFNRYRWETGGGERRETPEEVDAIVRDVLHAVKTEGLTAVLRLARQFDGVDLDETTIRVSAQEIEAGAAECPREVREAIAFAAGRIRAYHERQ